MNGFIIAAQQNAPAHGFVAGTLVHTRDGLTPIEKIRAGDWVLSRPDNPAQSAGVAHKQVIKAFRFVDRPVIRFWWYRNEGGLDGEKDAIYATPDHLVWLYPTGWVAMGRLHLPGKHRPGTVHRGDGEWLGRELILVDGSPGGMLDISDLYRTDRPEIAFHEEDSWGYGTLIDMSRMPPAIGEDVQYDYEKWGDPLNETRETYTTSTYNIELDDWHTYFVGTTGLWVRSGNAP